MIDKNFIFHDICQQVADYTLEQLYTTLDWQLPIAHDTDEDYYNFAHSKAMEQVITMMHESICETNTTANR